jgi:hypothetical protein
MLAELADLVSQILKYPALLGVFGILGGWVLGILSAIVIDLRKDRVQAKRVRKLITIEIKQNLDLFNNFWDRAQQSAILQNDSVIEGMKIYPERTWQLKGYEILRIPLPHFLHTIWDHQIPLLALALDEKGIADANQFHARFDRLTICYTEMADKQRDYKELHHARWNGSEPDSEAPRPVKEFLKLVAEIRESGNPLAK